MSRHRVIKSENPIDFDVEVEGEKWLWYSSEINPESIPDYINRFITQSLESTMKRDEDG